jgi:hypothetical protein
MITSKKSYLGRTLGLIISALLISSMFCLAAYAETPTMPDMSDMIPDGTNIPDTNIEGATGNDSTMFPEASSAIGSSSATQKPSSPIESAISPESTAPMGDGTDDGGMIGGILGIIIAIIVVIAIIILIVLLIPKRDSTIINRDKNHDTDNDKKNH